MLSHGPWLDKHVIPREQQNPFESIAVTELSNTHQFIDIFGRIPISRNGRKYTKLRFGHFQVSCVCRNSKRLERPGLFPSVSVGGESLGGAMMQLVGLVAKKASHRAGTAFEAPAKAERRLQGHRPLRSHLRRPACALRKERSS